MNGSGDPGWLALAAIAVPLAAVAGVLAAGRWPNLREAVSLAAGVALFAATAAATAAQQAGGRVRAVLAEPFPGLQLVLEAEPLGLLFALTASGLWIVTTVYAIGEMRSHGAINQTRFYAFFAAAIAAAMGVAFAGNLLTLFVFYEALTLATFPLVTHAGTPAARRAGRTYLGLLLATSIGFLLVAIVATYALAGTLDFAPGGILAGKASPAAAGLLLALYVFGVGKTALMPFHGWLPAAMVAPTPVSALLHAVAVVKAGVFTVLKVTAFVFGYDLMRELAMTDALRWVAAFTVVASSVVALTRDNLKARLAWSTIGQLSYIVLAALLAQESGLIGGGLHIVSHAFAKITLFFCAGAILVAHHRTEVSQLDGIGRTMPLTMTAFTVASLSLIGLPPFSGWSKWLMFEAALDADRGIFVLVLALATLLSVAYLLPIPLRAFLRAAPGTLPARVSEAPATCLVAIAFTALLCFATFFFPDPAFALLAGLFATPASP